MLVTCPKCSARYKVPSEISLKTGQKVQCSACECIFEFTPITEETTPSVSLLPPEDAVLSINAKTEEIVVHTHEPENVPDQKQVAPLPEVFQPVRAKQVKEPFPFGMTLLCFVLLICLVGIGWLWRDLLIMNRPFETSFMPTRPVISSAQEPKKRGRLPIRLEEHPPVAMRPVPPVPPVDSIQQQPIAAPIPEVKAPVLPSVQSVRFRKTPTNAVLIEGSLKNTSSETVPVPEKVYALAYGEDGTLLFEKEIHLPAGVLYPDMEQAFFGTYASEEKGVQWVDVVLKK